MRSSFHAQPQKLFDFGSFAQPFMNASFAMLSGIFAEHAFTTGVRAARKRSPWTMLHLPRAQLPVLMAGLALGTPLLSLIGAVIAALTVGMRRSGILVGLLALPLYVPVLVYGAGIVAASAQGMDAVGALLLLAAGLVVALVLAPLTAAAAIRIAVS